MLFKWIFTFLAILWLVQALRPLFETTAPPPQTGPGYRPRAADAGRDEREPPPSRPGETTLRPRPKDEDEDYIDYEEV